VILFLYDLRIIIEYYRVLSLRKSINKVIQTRNIAAGLLDYVVS